MNGSKIEVRLAEKDIYGKRKFYPMNDVAKKICLIARTITMTEATIAIVRDMGYEVVTDRIAFED